MCNVDLDDPCAVADDSAEHQTLRRGGTVVQRYARNETVSVKVLDDETGSVRWETGRIVRIDGLSYDISIKVTDEKTGESVDQMVEGVPLKNLRKTQLSGDGIDVLAEAPEAAPSKMPNIFAAMRAKNLMMNKLRMKQKAKKEAAERDRMGS